MISVYLFATTWEWHRLQDCKDRRCQEQRKKLEELVHFLQESTGACILFGFANIFELCKSHRKLAHNLLEVLHLSKHTANAW
jgi:hypothetical protein